MEYVVFGVPKDAPEINCEIPEGLKIGFASAEFKAKSERDLGKFMREKYGDFWLNALKTENWAVISGENIKDDKTFRPNQQKTTIFDRKDGYR